MNYDYFDQNNKNPWYDYRLPYQNATEIYNKVTQPDYWPIRNVYDYSKHKNQSYSAAQNSGGYAAQSSADKAAQEEAERQAKINLINMQKQQDLKLLNDEYNFQKDTAKKDNENNLKQLYIAYMQGMKNMDQQAALWGAGGQVESLENKKYSSYQSDRRQENDNYSDILSQLQHEYNMDLQELENKYLIQLMSI